MAEEFKCEKSDCTFAVTGTCLEAFEDAQSECPHLSKLSDSESTADNETVAPDRLDASDLTTEGRLFHAGMELGIGDARELMRSEYTHVVSILGTAETGKTCFLTSLYLLLTNRKLLPEWRFAGSRTLQGFEHRARHLRNWDEQGIPEQIVDRTLRNMTRSPAYLHLAAERNKRRFNFLMTDLPGEWTERLVADATTAERFGFLGRSDLILLTLDARRFEDLRTRHGERQAAIQLFQRLIQDVGLPLGTPLLLVGTKCDETNGIVPDSLATLAKEANAVGFACDLIGTASFSRDLEVLPHGHGVGEVLGAVVAPRERLHDATVAPKCTRSFLRVLR